MKKTKRTPKNLSWADRMFGLIDPKTGKRDIFLFRQNQGGKK